MARDNDMKSGERATETGSDQSFRDVLASALDVTAVSSAELARRIGSSGPAISQWLNKGNTPDLAVVIKIEDALGLRLGALVRHHSPEVWAIIETKMNSPEQSWKVRTWRQKFQEALIDTPLDPMERKIVQDTMEMFIRYSTERQIGPERRS